MAYPNQLIFGGRLWTRGLCRIQLLPVTHVLVDTQMLTVKLVYKLSNVPDDLKWAKTTHMTPELTGSGVDYGLSTTRTRVRILAAVLKLWANFFTLHCSSSLS